MKIQNFKGYVKVNENAKEGFVIDPAFPNYEKLLAHVKLHVSVDFKRFVKENKLPIYDPEIRVYEKDGNISLALASEPITDVKMFGPLFDKCGVKKATFCLFGGREVTCENIEGIFQFRPLVWTDLRLEVESDGNSMFKYNVEHDHPAEMVKMIDFASTNLNDLLRLESMDEFHFNFCTRWEALIQKVEKEKGRKIGARYITKLYNFYHKGRVSFEKKLRTLRNELSDRMVAAELFKKSSNKHPLSALSIYKFYEL